MEVSSFNSNGSTSTHVGLDLCPFFVLFVLTGALTSLFVMGYSGMGMGLEVIAQTVEYHDEAAAVLQTLGMVLGFLYVTDVHRWPFLLQEVLVFCGFVALCVSLLLLVTETPFGPLCVFTICMPLLLIGIKYTLFKSTPGYTYTIWIYRVLVTQGVLLLGLFFYWASQGENMWDSPTRAYYSDRCGCAINYKEFPECMDPETPDTVPCFWTTTDKVEVEFNHICTTQCLDVYEECGEAFLLWANPGLAAMALLVIGFLAQYLHPNDPHAVHGVSATVRTVAVVLFLLWIFASMAGAGDGLSNTLIAFAVSMFIGSAIVMSSLFWSAVKNESETDMKGAAQQAETYKDVFKGLLILAGLPLLIAYVILSVVNQFIRRIIIAVGCGGGCVKYTDEEKEHKGCVTQKVSEQIQDFLHWDHSKVLTYAVYWGFGYIFFNVLASKFTTLFLSWLIEYTAPMNILVVTGIVTFVGMILFLLPPIPGIPIYLTAGIVLVSVGQESLGLWGSIGYACAVSILIKLLACVMQQKMIGELFGRSVAVRQMVGINSEGIRAMRVVLSDPRLTMNKVFILVGGPDWPVSVLCGILGLDALPILIGTLPVAALVVPTVFAGSFAYMGSIENEDGVDLYPWADTMAAVASAIIAACMGLFTLSAAGAVKDTFEKNKEKIDAIPIDEEVKAADDIAQKENDAYSKATVWSNVPLWAKIALILSVASMIACK